MNQSRFEINLNVESMKPGIDERDGMWVEWDVSIEMDDGVVLKADVFRPQRQDNILSS